MKLKKTKTLKKKKASQIDEQLSRVLDIYDSGQKQEAIAAVQRIIENNPEYVRGYKVLAHFSHKMGMNKQALEICEKAIRLDPKDASNYANMGYFYNEIGEYKKALAYIEKAIEMNPSSPEAHFFLGRALVNLRRVREAIEPYKKSLRLNPALIDSYTSLASIYEQLNELEKAEEILDEAKIHNPDHHLLLLPLAKLKKRKKDPACAKKYLEELMGNQSAQDDESLMGLAHVEMGKIFDAEGEYEKAFEYFSSGQKILQDFKDKKKGRASYFSHLLPTSIEWFNEENVKSWKKYNPENDDVEAPVFIVGFPRSGTTLTEQILSAHPGLYVMGEYGIIDHMILHIGHFINRKECKYPDVLSELSDENINVLRQAYIKLSADAIRKYAGEYPDQQRLVDKLPTNIVSLGFIYRMFPEAKIIVNLRDPRDVVLSSFIQTFAEGAAMNRLSTLEGSAELYDEMMGLYRKFCTLFPLDKMELVYEELVEDPENKIKEMIKFIGEEWSDEVMRYHEEDKRRLVETPSYEGVAEPIYKRSKARWKNYAKQIEPVQENLASYIKAFGYE